MKKLTKKSLDELAKYMPVISEKSQQEIFGGTGSFLADLWNATPDGSNATFVNTGSGTFSGDDVIINYESGEILSNSFDYQGSVTDLSGTTRNDFVMTVDQLWTSSIENHGVESNALILSNGQIIWLKTSNNTTLSSSWQCDNIRTDPNTGYSYYKLSDTEIYMIKGIIHTHPNPDPAYFQTPTCYDDGRNDDWTSLGQLGGENTDVNGYVISNGYVWRYSFDEYGNKVEECLGTREEFMVP